MNEVRAVTDWSTTCSSEGDEDRLVPVGHMVPHAAWRTFVMFTRMQHGC